MVFQIMFWFWITRSDVKVPICMLWSEPRVEQRQACCSMREFLRAPSSHGLFNFEIFFVIVHLHTFKSYQSFCDHPTVIWSYMYKNQSSLWSPLLTNYGHSGTSLLRSSQCTFCIVIGNARDVGASLSEPTTKTCILSPAVRKEVSAED